MIAINDINGIIEHERNLHQKHVVIFLFIQPSDPSANEYISKFNYWHHRSGEYCTIYLIGYSEYFGDTYDDVIQVDGIENRKLEYSDECFSKVTDQLSQELKNWYYRGTPEIMVFQNNPEKSDNKILYFSAYNYVDINYGIKKRYIESFSRFMECLINASKNEIKKKGIINRKIFFRIKPKTIIEEALSDCNLSQNSIKRILKDKAFYRTSRSK